MAFSPDLRHLLDRPNMASIATVMPSGAPQVSAVWIGDDGNDILFTTVDRVQKIRNIRRDPRVAITIFDHEDPYTVASLSGSVTEITTEGGKELVDSLAGKYLGWDSYPEHPGLPPRLVVRIRVDKVRIRKLGYRRSGSLP